MVAEMASSCSVVSQKKIDYSSFRGIERGYIYNEKIKLNFNQLGSSYRHLGNYIRRCGFVPDPHQPYITCFTGEAFYTNRNC